MRIGYGKAVKSGIFVLMILSLLVILTPFSYADTVSLYGPETFTRTTGAPNGFERSFQIPSGVVAPFTIRVTNGTSTGENRISSASIHLNGIEVVKENDFNQQVDVIEKPIPFIKTENSLVVELRSNPGGFILVEIFGILTIPTVKKVIGPDGGIVELQGEMSSVKLDIPPGALPADTEIAIRQVPSPPADSFMQEGVPLGNTFSFEPHGLMFSKVATITFTYNETGLPPGANEGNVHVYRDAPDGHFGIDGGARCNPEEEPGPHCVDTESFAQDIDTESNSVTVFVNKFSRRLPYYTSVISGCGGVSNARPTQVTLEAGGFSLPILRCLRPGVAARPVTATITRIVVHSTSNGNRNVTFQGEVNCAIDPDLCPDGFAHYDISRDGTIVQVAEDGSRALHTRSNTTLNVSNSNSVGIELFNNIGEPYDGAQMTALIQLMDMLIRLHPTIARPGFPRVTVPTSPNLTSVFSHQEVDPTRRLDPVGTFRTSSEIWYFDRAVNPAQWVSMPLPGGNASASTLFDAVIAGVSAMGRDFPGLVNTSGGDSLGVARAGSGGMITYRAHGIPDADHLPVGTNYTDNAPLIVPPNTTVELTGNSHTDIIVNGTLRLGGDAMINVAGTLFIAPEYTDAQGTVVPAGRIVTSDALNGNALTLNTNGSPIIQGTIDLSGKNAEVMSTDGGNGGTLSISTGTEGPSLIPTLVSRGGDADQAAVSSNPFASQGGKGGDVVITSQDDIILSGGNPPVDTLPPPPPFSLSSIGVPRPSPGQRVPLRPAAFQVGFSRGILTSGGIGGSGGAEVSGGRGGDGGTITIQSQNGGVIFRDVDLITGAGPEMVFSQIFLPDFLGARNTYYATTGSLGGKGVFDGGSGGDGGNAGAITVTGTLRPEPVSFAVIGGPFDTGDIIGFNDGPRPRVTDYPWDFVIGQTIQAQAQDGSRLYRLRLDGAGQALGGSGGIPGGSVSSFPGFFGHQGAGGTISGLRIQ